MAELPIPGPLRRPVLGVAARLLRMDLSEAAEPLSAYRNVSELFTRPLRAGVRSWPDASAVAGSPVDGVVGHSGDIRNGTVLQAKGRAYATAELLDDAGLAGRFDGGAYLTLYLSPRHYHRIHAPVSGGVVG
ncbi:MAG: phosphatidylserine decarboxylase, partial [Gemmatimonadota bacterium]